MLSRIAAFEFRYQARSPLFRAAALVVFLASFSNMALVRFGTVGGGQVLYNAPHSIVVTHHLFSMVFLFLGAAFVSNVIVRDDHSGFGPIIRSTGITRRDYLLGRFAGAFAAGALILAAVPLGTWLGTLMPFANQDMLGPNRASGFLAGYGLFALPNALVMSAVLFALATATRSTAGTFLGVIGIFVAYLVSQRVMEGQVQSLDLRMLADPFGMTTYMAASRYLTAAELNAGALPVTRLMIGSRLLWVGLSLLLLAITVLRFRFSEPRISRRRQRRLAREAAATQAPPPSLARLPEPRFGARTSFAQFASRARMEARTIVRSPLFLFLLVIAFLVTFINLSGPTGWMDLPLYPLTSIAVPIIDVSFRTILLVIATYYGGELVWRERERGLHQIIDATPLPAWALMLPKLMGLALVLVATLLLGTAAGLLAQLLAGLEPAYGEFLSWYLLPATVDALLTAVLAVFVAALSPGKYAAWGVMFAYAMLLIFGPSLGLEYPLLVYGNVPAVNLTDMAGTGAFAPAAWWFRLFWAALALLLMIAAHLLWPRGTDQGLKPRLRRVTASLSGGAKIAIAGALALVVLTGSWVVYNTLILNHFSTSADSSRYLAEYEKRYFRYAGLPQPAVEHVQLDVALYPAQGRAEVRGRYILVNQGKSPIERVHLRLMNPELQLAALDFPGARLESNDARFDYRIYRLDRPMQPGEKRGLSFRTLRRQHGFRAAETETKLAPNGTVIDTLALTPRIGMSDVGLLEDPALRRKYGLSEQQPFPSLDDIAATQQVPSGADGGFTTADITISTSADQIPVSSGRRVSDRFVDGRRIARFLSDGPTKNLLPVQSARFAVARQSAGGIDFAIYYHPAQPWNVGRMMTAMRAAIAYCGQAFGPYQFGELSIVENPYGTGGHANPNSISVGEGIFTLDQRDPETLDMVTMLTAHEVAHQWWGHQVLGARMQGGSLLYETLAQYSALMVLKKLRGEADIRRYLQFQTDRYLSGRRTQVLAEQPLARVAISQQHIAYGKGALAFYLLQHRLGEDAVNRALRRFVARYRFAAAPYPRSLDLIRMLREEAKTPQDRQLITDLFERITLYDLQLANAVTARDATGWTTTFTVAGGKSYANGKGEQTKAALNDTIDIGLFAMDPAAAGFTAKKVLLMRSVPIRSGLQKLRVHTAVRPAFAGIDPYGLYIDRNASDNVKEVAGS